MQIRPILSALTRNKAGAILVALQIAVTLAVVINAVFIVQLRVKHMTRDSGMDMDNLIAVYSFGFAGDYSQEATVRADLDYLRSLPGVIDATPTRGVPLSGSGSATGYTATPDPDEEGVTANYYTMDDRVIETLGVTLAAGRSFRPEEVRWQDASGFGDMPDKAIVTKAFAQELLGEDVDPIGKRVYESPERSFEIVGVIEHMQGAWVNWDGLNRVVIYPLIVAGPHIRYLVRTEPGLAESLLPKIDEEMAAMDPTRVINRVKTLKETAARSYSRDRAMAIVLVSVVVMLVTVTALGIVGLAAFTVRQRTKQIGTRRAVGARRSDILSYFLTENWLMTTVGVAVGVALTLLLNYYLASEYSLDKLDPVYLPAGVFGMWAIGLLAVLGPARRAARISPAVATRTV